MSATGAHRVFRLPEGVPLETKEWTSKDARRVDALIESGEVLKGMDCLAPGDVILAEYMNGTLWIAEVAKVNQDLHWATAIVPSTMIVVFLDYHDESWWVGGMCNLASAIRMGMINPEV